MSYNNQPYCYPNQSEQPITVHNATPNQTRRGPWSPEEDEKLMELISIFGPSNWVRISNSLCTRTPKQCRERYHQNLKPTLNRSPITVEEGELIEKLVAKYGKKWAEISRHLNGRSDNAIKNWWNGGANRRRRASSAISKSSEEKNKSLSQSYQRQQQQRKIQAQPLPPPLPSQPQPSQHPQVQQLPQISFNTSMFGTYSKKSEYSTDGSNTPPPAQNIASTPPFKSNFSRSASFDTNSNNVLPPITTNLSNKRRLLDDHNINRRHSTANTIYQQNNHFFTNSHPNLPSTINSQSISQSTGNVSPRYGSPLLLGNQNSRNNSISQFEFSALTSTTNSSRRSSIAPDFFPNPLKDTNNINHVNSNASHKRNLSQNSFNSPLLTPSTRFSVSSGSGITTTSILSTNTSPVTLSHLKNKNSNSSSSIYSSMLKEKEKEEQQSEKSHQQMNSYSSHNSNIINNSPNHNNSSNNNTNNNNGNSNYNNNSNEHSNPNEKHTENTKISVSSLID